MSGGEAEERHAEAGEEAEVFGALGALLGVLEVVATDDAAPLTKRQVERMGLAIELGQRLQHYLDALLTLSAEDLVSRLRTARRALCPLVEHAVRGALRTREGEAVAVRWPSADAWSGVAVQVDASRFDRMLGALVAAQLRGLRDAVLTIEVRREERAVTLRLSCASAPAPAEPGEPAVALLVRAFARLLSLHGGRFSFDAKSRMMELSLPCADVASESA